MPLYEGIGNYKPIQISFVLYPFYFAVVCPFQKLFKVILLAIIEIVRISWCVKLHGFSPLWPDKQFGTQLRGQQNN